MPGSLLVSSRGYLYRHFLEVFQITPGIWGELVGEQVGANLFMIFMISIAFSYPYVLYAFTVKILIRKKFLSTTNAWSIFGGIIGISFARIVLWSNTYLANEPDAYQAAGIAEVSGMPFVYLAAALVGMGVGYVLET